MLVNVSVKGDVKEIVSQKELANRIGFSVPKVIDLRNKGIIQGVNIGNKWKFEVSEVWEQLRKYQEEQSKQFTHIKRNGRS
jgi:hypothetical protein